MKLDTACFCKRFAIPRTPSGKISRSSALPSGQGYRYRIAHNEIPAVPATKDKGKNRFRAQRNDLPFYCRNQDTGTASFCPRYPFSSGFTDRASLVPDEDLKSSYRDYF